MSQPEFNEQSFGEFYDKLRKLNEEYGIVSFSCHVTHVTGRSATASALPPLDPTAPREEVQMTYELIREEALFHIRTQYMREAQRAIAHWEESRVAYANALLESAEKKPADA